MSSESDSLGAPDNEDNDSDFSLSSFSNESGAQKRSKRTPSPDPLWLQARDLPQLMLPESSDDLIIPKQHSLKTASIYEVLRRFKNLVRLTPFRLEDLCAALASEEQSSLLTEVHIMLLKALLREEDSQSTHFGPLDHKDSINISMYLIDQITWPDILKNYLESDNSIDKKILNILTEQDYPYANIEDRLTVLQFLTDQFLRTTAVRDDLIREGPIHYDDHCRICHKLGDLLCCETCPAVFHLDCVDPPLETIPTGDYQCNLCKAQQLSGISDCISAIEKQGFLCRHEHMGYDRHGRKYWFVCRRIFVECEETEDIWYYSSVPQFEYLMSTLDDEDMESHLCREIGEQREEIIRQMEITESLTNKNKGPKKSYFEVENEKIREKMKKNDEEAQTKDDKTMKGKHSDKHSNENCEKDTEPTTPVINTNVVSTRLKTGSLTPRNYSTDDLKRRANGPNDENDTRLTRLKINQISNGTLLFKLGMENSFKNYVNQYATNVYALNKPQRNEERNKERYLSHEFSLTPASEFKWVGILNSTHGNVISMLRQTITTLEQTISPPFMHPHWPALRKMWIQAITHCRKPSDFAKILVILQSCVKAPVYTSVWTDKLGHTKLQRITLAEREEKKKLDKREKRERDDEEERNRLAINFVKYSLGLKHQVAKQKGEEYRIHGQWSWIWMSYGRKQHTLASNNCNKGEKIRPVQVVTKIDTDDDTEKVIIVDPNTFNFLKMKNDDSWPKIVPSVESFNQLNVSAALNASNRLIYPKIARKSVLDDLLQRRLQLKEEEDKKVMSPVIDPVEEGPPTHIIMKGKRQITSVEKELQKIMGIKTSTNNAVSAIPNVDMDFVNDLAKSIQSTRLQFSKLNRLGKQYKCYPSCEVNSTTFALSQVKNASCYSPICLQKANVKKQLLTLLRKAHTAGSGNKSTVNSIMSIINRKSAIPESKLSEGKLPIASYMSGDYVNGEVQMDTSKCQTNLLSAMEKAVKYCEEEDMLKYLKNNEQDEDFTMKIEPNLNGDSIINKSLDKIESETVIESNENGETKAKIENEEKDETIDVKRMRLNDSVSEVDIISNQDDIMEAETIKENEVVADEKNNITNNNDENIRDRRSSRRTKGRPPIKSTTTTTTTTTSVTVHTKYNDGSEESEKNLVSKSQTKDIRFDGNKISTTITDNKYAGISNYIAKPNRRFTVTKALKRENIYKEEKEFTENGIERIYTRKSTRGSIYLSKLSNAHSNNASRTDKIVVKYPPMYTFMTQKGIRSLMALQRWEVRQLARTGGKLAVSGFNHFQKNNMSVWPYSCSRPSFRTCWIFRTLSAQTLAAIALQIRILWCCLRWDDMAKRSPTNDGKYQETTESEISTMEILRHRIIGRFAEKTQYLRRKIVIPLEMPKTIRGEINIFLRYDFWHIIVTY